MDVDFILQLASRNGLAPSPPTPLRPAPTPTPPGDPVDLTTSTLSPMLQSTGGQFEIYHVTNNSDDPHEPGSFRHAVETGDPSRLRIVVFDVNGMCEYPLRSGPVYEPKTMRGNLIVAGETAPEGGFFVFGSPKIRKGNTILRHLTTVGITQDADWPNKPIYGQGGSGIDHGARETQDYSIVQNCSILHSYDTASDFRATGGRSGWCGFVDCFFGEPMYINSQGNELGSRHHYFATVINRYYNVIYRGNIFLNGSTRLPWQGGETSCLWVNNFHYNCGAPGSRHDKQLPVHMNFTRIAKGQKAVLNYIGNAYFGGQQSNVETLDGSRNNRAFIGYQGKPKPIDWWLYLDDNRFETNWLADYTDDIGFFSVSKGKRAQRYVSIAPDQFTVDDGEGGATINNVITWLGAPSWTIPFDVMPSQDVYGYCMAYAGARPGNRSAAEARMINSILNDDAFIPVTGDGRRPAVPLPAARTEPVDVPGIGRSNFRGGPGHAAIAGYDAGAITPLEAWLHQRHMAAIGIPDGAANYDPNVVAKWLYQSEDVKV